MTREELSNMQGALDMFDETLSELQSKPGAPGTNELLTLLNASAGLQIALLAEISDKLTQMSAEIAEIRFSNEELRQY